MHDTLLNLANNLLNLTSLSYLIATVLYLFYLAKRSEGMGKAATALGLIGLCMHTVALALRWLAGGINHPPFTNLYESLIFFGWGIVGFYLYMEWRYKVRMVGAFVFPITLAVMGIAAMTPSKGIENLMPALQSYWLTFHVMFASVAYAAFIVAFAFSFMYLVKDQVQMRSIGLTLSVITAGSLALFDKASIITKGKFYLDMMIEGQKVPVRDVMPMQFEVVPIPLVGTFFLLAFILLGVAFIVYLFSYLAAKPNLSQTAFYALLGGTIALTLGLLVFVVQVPKIHEVSFSSNPYKLALLGLEWLAILSFVILHLKQDSIIERLPELKTLDLLGYRSVVVAFPLMTIVVVTGAVWANSAWGTYWQWDPKETWSLITWFIYAIYLHARIMAEWSGRRTAIISILGFVSVVFTYLGVNVFLSGLHSYASS